MKIHRSISPVLFLLLFVTPLLHDIVPHVHHQHDLTSAIASADEPHHHESHGDHHHHSDEQESDEEQGNFFDFLFKNHSHSKHTHQYTHVTVEQVKSTKQHVSNLFYPTDELTIDLKDIDIGALRYFLFKNFKPNQPYLLSYLLRGPPLG